MTRNATGERWFELISDSVAHYVDDVTSEVYAQDANAPYFVRVREDDGSYHITQLTNDTAELIGGEAHLTYLTEETVAAVVSAMLSETKHGHIYRMPTKETT